MDFQTRNVNYIPLLSPRSDVSALTNYEAATVSDIWKKFLYKSMLRGGKNNQTIEYFPKRKAVLWQALTEGRRMSFFLSGLCLGDMQVMAISWSIWVPTGANQQDLESNSPSPRWVDRTHLFPNHKDYLESIVNLNSNNYKRITVGAIFFHSYF